MGAHRTSQEAEPLNEFVPSRESIAIKATERARFLFRWTIWQNS